MDFNIPSSAQINWETLALHDTVQSDGYVEILVANESDVPTFFDNVDIYYPARIYDSAGESFLSLWLADARDWQNTHARKQMGRL